MRPAEALLSQAVTTVRGRRARPETDAALADWLWDVLGVSLPARACCPEHTAPFDAFAHAYFAREPIAVWKASRGFGGKSYMLAALALAEAARGAEVRVLRPSVTHGSIVAAGLDAPSVAGAQAVRTLRPPRASRATARRSPHQRVQQPRRDA